MARAQPDIESRPPEPQRFGFASLAAYIAEDQDKSISIYRAFQRLSARNLLYLEAELSELEEQLDYFDNELLQADTETQRWARSWKGLVASSNGNPPNPRAKERINIVMRIRKLMKEYHKSLILEEAVLKMGKPHRRQVKALEYFSEQRYKRPGRRGPMLTGLSAHRLDNEDDLIVLSKPVDQDWLIRFVRRYFRVFFLEPNQQLVGDLAHISERRIAQAVGVVATVIAAALLVGAIVNLYFVTNNNSRLGLIGAYTATFSVSVAILTNAKRAELFACTAAYAAVLAVFVSGPLAAPPEGT